MQSSTYFLPSEIERETGFGKEQLRKWRQRFGFPPKESNVDGKIAYSGQTVEQLHLIRRLLEAGFRPAQVVGKTVLELEKLKLELGLNALVYAPDESIVSLIEYIKLNDLKGFLSLLIKKRGKQIMLDFVQNTIAPLMIGIGEAWRRDEIDIHHEHLCSAHIERYLHAEILRLRPREGLPVILLALPPGEHHLLGLLMAEAVLAEEGATTINIGSGIPLNNLKLAAITCKADVVALSFSFAHPSKDILPTILHFRRLLPPEIQIWVGGAGISVIRKKPKGVDFFYDFKDVVFALNNFSFQ
ncbi:MAG: cobalamin B12-binding domain-containing protein [Cryomorphaceae bacterium]|jgi:DNA-binding transcriptional MerR regulator|nr:cobalamin B12-binding domain-containing protein [Cryomorphaceae bacterium]